MWNALGDIRQGLIFDMLHKKEEPNFLFWALLEKSYGKVETTFELEVFDSEALLMIKANIIIDLHMITIDANPFWFGKRLQKFIWRQVRMNVLQIHNTNTLPGLEDDQIKRSWFPHQEIRWNYGIFRSEF